MEQMLAAQMQGLEDISISFIDPPKLEKGGMIVKVESCAICGSDLRIYRHGNPRITFPQVIGHEISGTIVEIDKDVSGFKLGDKIAMGADIPCGSCTYCKRGVPNCCITNYAIGYQYKGGFAQYIGLDERIVKNGPVQKVSKALDFNLAALSEPLACCINGFELVRAQADHSICIFGAGPIGTMLCKLAIAKGMKEIFVSDPNPHRLAHLKEEHPDIVSLCSKDGEVVNQIMECTGGRGVDLVFTACPAVAAQKDAIAIVGRRGIVNFFGGLPSNSPLVPVDTNDLHYREISLTGSHGSTPLQHQEAVHLIETGTIKLDRLISHTFPLSQINEAFATSLSQGARKIVIKPNEGA